MALLASVLALAFLGACGNSDSEGSGAGSTATEATTQAEAGGEGSGKDTDGLEQGSGGSGQGDVPSTGNDEELSSRTEVETPLKVSGGGSEQFRVKGGDNSIEEFGEEADKAELREVAQIVHGFYVARATGDWARACSYLAQEVQEKLEQLDSRSSAKSCASALDAFTTDLPSSVWREVTTVDAVSLRHDGQQAFLIYRGAKGQVYAMPLYSEDGEWRITALSGAAQS